MMGHPVDAEDRDEGYSTTSSDDGGSPGAGAGRASGPWPPPLPSPAGPPGAGDDAMDGDEGVPGAFAGVGDNDASPLPSPTSSSAPSDLPPDVEAALGRRVLADMMAAVEEGGEEGAPSGPGGDDSDSFGELPERPPSFCVNCTAPVWWSDGMNGGTCGDCGRDAAADGALFAAPTPPTPSIPTLARVALAFDERMLLHRADDGPARPPHPERPDRVAAAWARLVSTGAAAACARLPSRLATDAELTTVHSGALVTAISGLSEARRDADAAGRPMAGTPPSLLLPPGPPPGLSPDTFINGATDVAARLAAGACADVCLAVARGGADAGLALVRPPGHHAESNTAMGFCLFNNAAVAARAVAAAWAAEDAESWAADAAAAAAAGLPPPPRRAPRKILILDNDVHHGNGRREGEVGAPPSSWPLARSPRRRARLGEGGRCAAPLHAAHRHPPSSVLFPRHPAHLRGRPVDPLLLRAPPRPRILLPGDGGCA